MLNEFLMEYGTTMLYTVITAIAGYIGIAIKNAYNNYVKDKQTERIVKIVVKAVNQLYKDLNGEEKLVKAIDTISEMLGEKGIHASELEIRMLIESAVAEFKGQINEREGEK